jgi:hypothetical protein
MKKTLVKFGLKGFCTACGHYTRGGLTWVNFVDATGKSYRKAELCPDCYAQLSEKDDDKQDLPLSE